MPPPDEQLFEFKNAFTIFVRHYDKDGNGLVLTNDLENVLKTLGIHYVPRAEKTASKINELLEKDKCLVRLLA